MPDYQLVRIKKVASMLDMSVDGVRVRLTQRRNGKGSGDFPMPISGRKERLTWLRSEIESYIHRRNNQANHQTLQPQTQQLSPESLLLANKFGLDDSSHNKSRTKKGEK